MLNVKSVQKGGEKMKTIFYSIVGLVALGVSTANSASVIVRDAGLVPYEVMDDSSIPKSLTGVAGDAANGRKIAISRKKGNCLACHVMPIPEQQFHGETARHYMVLAIVLTRVSFVCSW